MMTPREKEAWELCKTMSDKDLDIFAEAIRHEKGNRAQERKDDMKRGDTVRFINLGTGSKYMTGHTAVIVEKNAKTLWVELTPESRRALVGTRFGRTSRIKVYPQNIELAYLEGESSEALPKLVSPNG
jgi:ribosomal protein S17